MGVLYWQSWRWQCRKCAGLVHESTRQGDDSQAFAKVNKVRDALGWGGGLASPMGGRKKGDALVNLRPSDAGTGRCIRGGSRCKCVVIEQQMNLLGKLRVPK